MIVVSGTDIGMFSITQPNITSLNSGESIDFTVSFVPNSLGSKSVTIQIANDDSNESTYVINLTGTGSAPAPEIDVRENGVSYASGSIYKFGDAGIGGQGAVSSRRDERQRSQISASVKLLQRAQWWRCFSAASSPRARRSAPLRSRCNR